MIFDHIVLSVSDINKSKHFYTHALKPLGIDYIKEDEGCVGFGVNGKASFWICNDTEVQKPMHIAFIAPDRKAVDKFHSEGIQAGGTDNGAPGLRVHYQPNYYAAFVLDPDGHNVEGVCRKE